MALAFTFLSVLIYPAAIIMIVYFAVNGTKKGHSMSREAMIALILLSATVSGLVGLTFLPNKILGIESNALNFGIRIAIGVVLIIVGVIMKSKIQRNFILVLGLILIFLQSSYVFENFGSYGALIVVTMAFFALIIATVLLTRKHSNG